MSTTEVEQLQLFVNDEKTAIQWVRQQLTEHPMSYQELSPLYMKEAQRVWEKQSSLSNCPPFWSRTSSKIATILGVFLIRRKKPT